VAAFPPSLHRYRLCVEESHALGVLGAHGRGACEAAGLAPGDAEVVCASMGTALASVGGFCVGSHEVGARGGQGGLGEWCDKAGAAVARVDPGQCDRRRADGMLAGTGAREHVVVSVVSSAGPCRSVEQQSSCLHLVGWDAADQPPCLLWCTPRPSTHASQPFPGL
jgi:hypothetical protein